MEYQQGPKGYKVTLDIAKYVFQTTHPTLTLHNASLTLQYKNYIITLTLHCTKWLLHYITLTIHKDVWLQCMDIMCLDWSILCQYKSDEFSTQMFSHQAQKVIKTSSIHYATFSRSRITLQHLSTNIFKGFLMWKMQAVNKKWETQEWSVKGSAGSKMVWQAFFSDMVWVHSHP